MTLISMLSKGQLYIYLQVKASRHNSGIIGRNKMIRKEKQFPLGFGAIRMNVLPVTSASQIHLREKSKLRKPRNEGERVATFASSVSWNTGT